eukprot:8661343-Lingulodinium_polyedra.AAC.1
MAPRLPAVGSASVFWGVLLAAMVQFPASGGARPSGACGGNEGLVERAGGAAGGPRRRSDP